MDWRPVAISLAVCLGLAALVAWLLDWSIEKAIILAPVIVVVAGGVGFLLVLWGKVIKDSIGRR